MTTDNRTIAQHLSGVDLTTPQNIRLPTSAAAYTAVELDLEKSVEAYHASMKQAQVLMNASMRNVFEVIGTGMLAAKATGKPLAESSVMVPLAEDNKLSMMFSVGPQSSGGPPVGGVAKPPVPGKVTCALIQKPDKAAVEARKESLAKYRA